VAVGALMTGETLGKAVAGVAAGALIGWAANALTMAGRVSALEASLSRIETTLTVLVMRQGEAPAEPAAPAQPRRMR